MVPKQKDHYIEFKDEPDLVMISLKITEHEGMENI